MIGREATPQVTRNDVTKFFQKLGLFKGQKYRRLEDQKQAPGLACNLGFAEEKRLEPKIYKISKIVYVGRHVEQTSLVQTYHRRRSGGRRWVIFRIFFLKKKLF